MSISSLGYVCVWMQVMRLPMTFASFRANQHRVMLVHRCVGKFDRLGEQGDENAHRLIDHTCAADDDQQNVKYTQQYH